MAQATEPGGSSDFPGDEFANNLFSDLAPLLTLFGEQVTKQFLSMSMGWADNVLLAMGPLGILTVVVSAIRVGGVRQLKALVGRAREGISTVEQELLSSTSPDVCELWSGKEIVRMIGSPAGMKSLIVTTTAQGKAQVLDLRTAVAKGVVHSSHFNLSTPGVDKILEELGNAAPNLALNVKNSTAPTWQLWLWALLGVALQLAAMIMPGITTFYWKWEKAGRPVSSYGYPCFLIGTGLVVTGVMTCGHVIEGITAEHYFHPNKDSRMAQQRMEQVVRLQRSCTVGDQHFPAFAIFNSPGDLTLRMSRLSQKNYSVLAATAAATTVLGFIVQFVGLRALHWSATITQLGVTVLMTGVRAYVRRGLATNPICQDMLEGHETACLALRLLQHNASGEGTWNPTLHLHPQWEVQTLHDLSGRSLELDRSNLPPADPINSALLLRVKALFPDSEFTTPLGVGHSLPLDGAHELLDDEAAELHESIHKLMPQHDCAVDLAEKLAKAIERLTATFANLPEIQWADSWAPFESHLYRWDIPVTVRFYPKDRTTTAARFVVKQGPAPDTSAVGPRPWVLQHRSRLHSVLALWLYTLEKRLKAVAILDSTPGIARFSNARHYLAAFRHRNDEQYYLRVVASGERVNSTMLQGWLGKHIYYNYTPDGATYFKTSQAGHRRWPVFGAFLSTQTSSRGGGYNFHIRTPRESDMALQCAQELLSLFLLDVASKVQSIGGTTTRHPLYKESDAQSDNVPRPWNNSVFQALAEDVVETGLAHDMTEAYTLIIPAFHHYRLLPTEPGTKPPFPRDITPQTQDDDEIQPASPASGGAGDVDADGKGAAAVTVAPVVAAGDSDEGGESEAMDV